MVKDTRAATGTGALQALKQPTSLTVKMDGDGFPKVLKLRDRWVDVEAVSEKWRIDDEYWREQPISRMYYQCVVDHGISVTVYQDLVSSGWYWQRV